MADPAKEGAVKQRIISHMNGDHQDSLRLYLRHQHHLDEPTVANAKLIDINQKQVVIVASGKSYTLTLDPPMASMKEARERMVAMDADARRALGVPAPSHGEEEAAAKKEDLRHQHAAAPPPPAGGPVTTFVPPAGFDYVVWFAVLSTLLVFSRGENVRPGGWAYEHLGGRAAPRFAAFCQALQPWLFPGMLALHGAEAAYMGLVRLPRHGVRIGAALWLKWVLSTFVDGVCSYRRLSALVKKQQQARKAKGVTNGKAH